jgi:hypothetical protein
MRLWHLERKDDLGWGVTREFWIAAKTDQAARELASDTDEEDRVTWLDRRRSHCSEEGKADPRRKTAVVVSRYQFPDIVDKLVDIGALEEENRELRRQIAELVKE